MSSVQRLTGYVALIDVLGFRDLVGRDAHLGYMDTIAELIDDPNESRNLQYVLFSDSVIINTRTVDGDSLWQLLTACSSLFSALLQHHIPLRGAVAHGQFYRSAGTDRGVIVAGRPIVDAYHYETSQHWIGIMLCPSTIRMNPDLAAQCTFPAADGKTAAEYFAGFRWPRVAALWGGIPFHAENPLLEPYAQQGVALLPMGKSVASIQDFRSSLQSSCEALEWMKLVAPDPASQAKYTSTLFFLTNVMGRIPAHFSA